jgi:hypothetical protein
MRITAALATGRRYIKLHGRFDEAVAIGGERSVTLLADPGATLTRSSGGGPALTVEDAASLAVHDLAIADTSSTQAVGILVPVGSSPTLSLIHVAISNNAGGGLSIAGGSFTIAQSTIASNLGGGIAINGHTEFAIVSNIFIENGSPGAALGAISVSTFPSSTNQLAFNSFYRNVAQDGTGSAIQCVAGPFTARNNIMSTNGTLTNLEQVGGTCAHAYSIVRPGTSPEGPGNLTVDPGFRSPDTGDLHLEPRSPAARAADPASDLTALAARDPDGVVRVRPATIGAYQVP